MIAEKYGVGLIRFEGDDSILPCVQFGDGKTSVFTTVWDKQNVGLKIGRCKDEVEPFKLHEYDEHNPPHEVEGDEIHIMFDNQKSIDVMIGRLEYIKRVMLGDIDI